MTLDAEAVVVGSGPGGAQAAATLIEAGVEVTMLDIGITPDATTTVPTPTHFVDARRTDEEQHRYFLGDDFSGIPLQRLGAAPQVTPPRRHVLQPLPDFPRITTDGFVALESHALGGLGGAWGAVSFPYTDAELARSELPVAAMRAAYERVAARIGITGADDDLASVRGRLAALQPPLPVDHNAEDLLAAYADKRHRLRRRGIVVGRAMLAALSEDRDCRSAHPRHDMDFWANHGASVYRPDVTIRDLLRSSRFTYAGGWCVELFSENGEEAVEIVTRCVRTGEPRRWRTRRLLLAAGALGTTRIVLRSLGLYDRRVPLACNAHLYVPCVHLRQLGRPHVDDCHSLAQLTMIHDPTGDQAHLAQAQMYSYRSLLLFRLLPHSPLPLPQSLALTRMFAPSFVIWAIEHEDEPDAGSYCVLHRDGTFEAVHQPSSETEALRRRSERAMMRAMRQLGCWPIRRVHSGHGSSLHYGGQFPGSSIDAPLTTDRAGRLRPTRAVHVVDGSALKYLPAKGLTLTIMANADRVARGVAAALR